MSNGQDTQASEARPDLQHPWSQPIEEVLDALDVSADTGLDADEVEARRERYGRNRLREAETRSALEIFLEQFKSLIIGLLALAAAFSFAFGDWVEGGAVVAVIIINTLIGFVTELRAVRSMEALQDLSSVSAKVRREGQVQEIPGEEIVPGDILVLSGGDIVTSDVRLIEASKLQVDESALTGESVPVAKQTAPVDEDTPLAERQSMAYKGTAVTRGSGEGAVVATGMATELGNISSLVAAAEEEATPLEERLQALGRKLIWVTLGIAAIVAVAGVVAGRGIRLMLETAIALAVASVPEGLPIVATVALARGMWRMARRNALISRLSAVETLGATNVILTDKTGTLTENRMTLVRIVMQELTVKIEGRGLERTGAFIREDEEAGEEGEETIDPDDHARLRQVVEMGVLCNNAALPDVEDVETEDVSAVGDPLEVALLVAGAKADIERDELLSERPEAREVAFDAETKMMATFHEVDGEYRVAVKGALEAVIDVSQRIRTPDGVEALDEDARERWRQRNHDLATQGLRIIALATKSVDDVDQDPYADLTFLGLAALLDPPREEVRDAIETCQGAGIDVVMITGDQPATARNIAMAVGLIHDEDARVIYGLDLESIDEVDAERRQEILETAIFARVSPKQKLDLIALHQDTGAIVAMTGDGVNDAPALKKADIGVAMGKRGTQVAREAADMILKDDAFETIAVAVEQGRAIFGNIRKFVLYLLSCNVAEILVVGLASVVNAPLPIRPLQILFLNLVTDVFPALALGMGEAGATLMDRPPRDPEESILTRRHWVEIFGYSSLITLAVLSVLAIALLSLGIPQKRAVSLSFLTLAFAQLWHVFDMRDHDSRLLRNEVVQNPYVWGALGLCVLLLLAAVYVPFLANLLQITPPTLTGWGLVLGMSLVPLVLSQIFIALDPASEV
jgi:Ca2+-transporting ATPase